MDAASSYGLRTLQATGGCDLVWSAVTYHASKVGNMAKLRCTPLSSNPALQALEAARCLDDVRAAHVAYLHAVRRLRLSDPERDWHVVASAITAVLNAVLQFCALVRSSRRQQEVRPLSCIFAWCMTQHCS